MAPDRKEGVVQVVSEQSFLDTSKNQTVRVPRFIIRNTDIDPLQLFLAERVMCS